MPKLEIISGPQAGLTFTLTSDRPDFVIGRNPANPIVLVDMNASRSHARVVTQGDMFAIEDMGSSNGTFLNGAPVLSAMRLTHGDEVKVGGTLFRYVDSDSVPPPENRRIPLRYRRSCYSQRSHIL